MRVRVPPGILTAVLEYKATLCFPSNQRHGKYHCPTFAQGHQDLLRLFLENQVCLELALVSQTVVATLYRLEPQTIVLVRYSSSTYPYLYFVLQYSLLWHITMFIWIRIRRGNKRFCPYKNLCYQLIINRLNCVHGVPSKLHQHDLPLLVSPPLE